jgi:hypothetical protein
MWQQPAQEIAVGNVQFWCTVDGKGDLMKTDSSMNQLPLVEDDAD